MNKLVIVLTILLAGCIVISASTAADIDVQSIDPSDSYVSAIEQNSLNDLNDSNVEPGTKSTGDDKYVTNLKAISTDDNDISKLGATNSFTDLYNLIEKDTTGTVTLSADDIYKYDSSVDFMFSNTGIRIDKTIVIEGRGCTINGLGLARAFQIDANNVIIKNINFINTFTLKDGGAIHWAGANGVVSDCTFSNTNASNGGAIYWSSVGGTVSGVDFVNCSADKNGPAVYIASSGSLNISDSTCTPIDKRAPIYNDGTILSPVMITTMDGKTKRVANGEVVNVTGIITTSDMRVAGGVLTLTVNGTNLTAGFDETGLYSAEYTVGFTGTEPVNATYKKSTEELQSLVAGKLTTEKFDVNVTVSVNSSSIVDGDFITVTVSLNESVTSGNVTLFINGVANQTKDITGNSVVFTNIPLSAGKYNITAVFNGNDDYNNASANNVSVNVKAIPSINVTNISGTVYGETLIGTAKVTEINKPVGNMENTGNPLLVLLIALAAIGLESFRRKF